MEEIKSFELSGLEAEMATGFKPGDKVKHVKKVDSGKTGRVTAVIGPLFDPETNGKAYKVMVNFHGVGERACNPENLKKI